ncbi:CarD family transcriptional regulator [bacterium BFN5]|nr:CarD family transcriptional regulator [bacterium BFN5]QJW45645.1 CarD family transcriptional regulator [bacterium BFN5]GBG55331.1 CarD family transcriptional regulator [Sporomusaceae bacterium FL31]GCE32956.1 CarD family transcriptional regulator [Sporomusaceae bacterium]
MFQIGDKIFYPMQGGCIILAIEEREILGETQLYYMMNIVHRNMQVSIPVDKIDQLGIRPIVNSDELENVLTTFHDGETDTSCRDNQRYRRDIIKLKSGDIYEGAEVIRDLIRISNKKKLGITDKNMLDNARQILISEVVLVKGIPLEQASDLLDQVINVQ